MPTPEQDPFDMPEYAAFVESMIPHCRCCDAWKPCDGVLAGGICDDHQEADDDEFDEDTFIEGTTMRDPSPL